MNNLLVNLRKWVSRQDENFTTESLAHLLRQLCEHEPGVAARLLTKMTGNVVTFTPEEVGSVRITTQVTTPEGRPDIEISVPGSLVYVEAKVESGLDPDQLRRYRADLIDAREQRKVANTALVLLTRYPVCPAELGGEADAAIRWHDIAEWLSAERGQAPIDEPVTAYITVQFLEYLKARRMTMEPVTWELGEGARSLQNLLIMLSEAALACGVSCNSRKIHHLWGNQHYFGFLLDTKRYWFGVSFNDAEKVCFHTNLQINPDAAKHLKDGYVWESRWVPGGKSWECDLNLASEDVHFFARSLASQKECLERFLKHCLEAAKQIEITDPTVAAPTPVGEPSEHEDEEEDFPGNQP